jgi:hypothetical protein
MAKEPKQKGVSQDRPEPSSSDGGPSLTIYWNRVYEKTRTDKLHLRKYGLPPDTPVFRIVQCEREKGTLYGDVDHIGRKSGDLTQVVRDIVEGRPPEGYSSTSPILTEPSLFFFRTCGKLKRIEERGYRGRVAAEEIGDKMTIIDANALVSEEVIDLVAEMLVDVAMRKQEGRHGGGHEE